MAFFSFSPTRFFRRILSKFVPKLETSVSVSLFSLRKLIYLGLILAVSSLVIFPWSFFIFSRIYEDYLKATLQYFSNQIIVPVQFSYEYSDVPGFSITSISRSEISRVLRPQTYYDIYFDFNGYCSTSKETSPFLAYSVKSSLVLNNTSNKLLQTHHRDHNVFPFKKVDGAVSSTPEIASSPRTKSSWPLSKYLSYIYSDFYKETSSGPFYLSNVQSFVFSCFDSENMVHPLLPPILIHFIPPFIYNIGIPTLFTPTSRIDPHNHLSLKVFDSFKLTNDTIASDIMLELNNPSILVDSFHSRLTFKRVSPIRNVNFIIGLLLDVFGWIVSNELVVYTVGVSLVYCFNMFVYLFILAVGFFYFGPIANTILEKIENSDNFNGNVKALIKEEAEEEENEEGEKKIKIEVKEETPAEQALTKKEAKKLVKKQKKEQRTESQMVPESTSTLSRTPPKLPPRDSSGDPKITELTSSELSDSESSSRDSTISRGITTNETKKTKPKFKLGIGNFNFSVE